jgi:hypothetical protein
MEILNQILPFLVSIITLIVGWLGGRRKSTAEVEIIKSDRAEKLLKLNDQYLGSVNTISNNQQLTHT